MAAEVRQRAQGDAVALEDELGVCGAVEGEPDGEADADELEQLCVEGSAEVPAAVDVGPRSIVDLRAGCFEADQFAREYGEDFSIDGTAINQIPESSLTSHLKRVPNGG